MNRYLLIQLWGEQKHPKPETFNKNITTKQYFEQDKANEKAKYAKMMADVTNSGGPSNKGSAAADTANMAILMNDYNQLKAKNQRYEFMLVSLSTYNINLTNVHFIFFIAFN